MKEKYRINRLTWKNGLVIEEKPITKYKVYNKEQFENLYEFLAVHNDKKMTYEIEIKKIPENEDDKAVLEYYKHIDEELLKNYRNIYL